MKFLPVLVFASLITSTLFGADSLNSLTDEEKAAGWKLLFDGQTSAGWVALGKTEFPSGWAVEEGMLKRTTGGGDIVTTESYSDFELTWEWNIAYAGNS